MTKIDLSNEDWLAIEREYCARSLANFVKRAWKVLEPDMPYVHGWHLDAIAEHLEAVSYGQITRLLINVPPGSSKSLFSSVFFNSWEWGPRKLPSLRYLTTSFNDGPVTRDTRKCRDLILSDWYQSLWPEVRLTRAGETSFANDKTGTREGHAFGSLTSQRGDRLIIDDPHSTETAESDAERLRTTRKFREGAQNRLNNQQTSAMIVIMQRLHSDDVSGVIEKVGMDFEKLILPMEYESDRHCTTSIGFSDPRKVDGELLDPIRMPRETVDKLKRDMGSYAYAGQYQQRPAPREGGLFKRAWFDTVGAAPSDTVWVRGWDLAATDPKKQKGTEPAYTAGVKVGWSRTTKKYYIGHVVRDRLSSANVERLIVNTAKQDGKSTIVSIPQDPGQSGKAQVNYLVTALAGYTVHRSPESGSKVERANPVAAQAEADNVKVLRGDWNDAYLDEIESFPNGSFLDQVDATSRAFNRLFQIVTNEPEGDFAAPIFLSAGG